MGLGYRVLGFGFRVLWGVGFYLCLIFVMRGYVGGPLLIGPICVICVAVVWVVSML